MATITFAQAHASDLVGALTTVDRLIIHGHLTSFWKPGALQGFLKDQGLGIRDFAEYVHGITEKLKRHAEALAARVKRPFIYLPKVVQGKDDMAREIARKDGVREGLICVFSTLELASCFAVRRDRQTGFPEIVPELRKCLHLYFYAIDRELGFMHLRLQTWFPFQIQIYVNGREWLARQLDKRGIGYERYENTFLRIDDIQTAAQLCSGFAHRRWWRTFAAMARRVNPLLALIRRLDFGDYYWVVDECEIATDLMWRDRPRLLTILDDLFDHALRAFSADDVRRFLGYKRLPYKGEVVTTRRRGQRPECRLVKHRIKRNWIKMYDKWSVLRIETVINYPKDFRVLRFDKDRRGRRRGRWVPMAKALKNLWRYLQIGEAANHRYIEALAEVKPTRQTIHELDQLTRSHVVDGRRYPRLNPVAEQDCAIFRAVLAGRHSLSGFRNRHLQAGLYSNPVTEPAQAKRRCARVCRLISKLRGHGLVAKIPHSRLYRVTTRGHRLMGAALRFRDCDFPQAAAA